MKTSERLRILVVACALLLGMTAAAPGRIIYVDDDAAGANDGSSWADAFPWLRDALGVAVEGDEIQVAQGTYQPDQGADIKRGDHQATFIIGDGVVLRGGYAGVGAPDPDARNVEVYRTVLSGDLNNDDPNVQDGHALRNAAGHADNSSCVVRIKQVASCVLDGFLIRGGHSSGGGGGLRIEGSWATVWNCTFTQNWAPRGGAVHILRGDRELPTSSEIHHCRFLVNAGDDYGGGVLVEKGELLLTACEFADNTADRGGGLYSSGADVTLSGCTFNGNSAVTGAGVSHGGGNLRVTGCTFVQNRALPAEGTPWHQNLGGAMLISTSVEKEVLLTDCLFRHNEAFEGGAIEGSLTAARGCRFTGNVAYYSGGAIDSDDHGPLSCEDCLFDGNRATVHSAALSNYGVLSLTNCTFTGNRSPDGYVFHAFGGHGAPVDITLRNCIVWGQPHGLDPKQRWLSKAAVAYSDIEGGYP